MRPESSAARICPHGVDLAQACYCKECDDADGTTEAVAAMGRIGSAATPSLNDPMIGAAHESDDTSRMEVGGLAGMGTPGGHPDPLSDRPSDSRVHVASVAAQDRGRDGNLNHAPSGAAGATPAPDHGTSAAWPQHTATIRRVLLGQWADNDARLKALDALKQLEAEVMALQRNQRTGRIIHGDA